MVVRRLCLVVKGKKEARKVLRKVKITLSESDSRTYHPEKREQAFNSTCTKAEARIRKEKGKEGACPQSGLSASETPSEEGYGHTWESDDWYSGLTDDSSTSAGWSCLHGWRQSKGSKNVLCITALRQSFVVATRPLCLPTLRRRAVGKNCIIHLPTTPPCSTRVDVLETGNVPILFSHPQMKHLGMTIELDPKEDKITCPAFGLYSSPAEYSTMGHIVLDLTSVAYQPKSRERPAQLKRHVTFALSEQKSAYPAHTRENLTKMVPINLLFVRNLLPFLKMKMMNVWCDHHQEKNW